MNHSGDSPCKILSVMFHFTYTNPGIALNNPFQIVDQILNTIFTLGENLIQRSGNKCMDKSV